MSWPFTALCPTPFPAAAPEGLRRRPCRLLRRRRSRPQASTSGSLTRLFLPSFTPSSLATCGRSGSANKRGSAVLKRTRESHGTIEIYPWQSGQPRSWWRFLNENKEMTCRAKYSFCASMKEKQKSLWLQEVCEGVMRLVKTVDDFIYKQWKWFNKSLVRCPTIMDSVTDDQKLCDFDKDRNDLYYQHRRTMQRYHHILLLDRLNFMN